MRMFQVCICGEPLKLNEQPTPVPKGSEVLLKVLAAGVCHSDLHLADGYFDLGGGKRMSLEDRGMKLPVTLGHENVGEVVAVGPDVKGVTIGQRMLADPWIGCGKCAACQRNEDNLCMAMRSLGVFSNGGYADYVLVPHPRYLIDYAPLSAAFAGTLMCSGLTAYAALKRLIPLATRGPVLLVGLGGVGMMGLSLARTMLTEPPLVADIDAGKRAAALTAGAAAAFDPADPGARKAIMTKTGGLFAVCDFVGSERSLQFATSVLTRGGRVVVTGLLGGAFTTPVAMFALKAMTIEGVLTGTLAEAREVVALARTGKVTALPIAERPLAAAQSAFDDLRAGRVIGRVVLTAD